MSHLFLTGATGLVGSEFLQRALAQDLRVICLTRRAASFGEAVVLRGDLSNFEVDPRDVNAILHCAAETRFSLGIDEIRSTNLEGTRRVLEFARRCPKLEKLGYVSTVFTCGRMEGSLNETRWRPPAFTNTYQQSKWEAEELVFDRMRDLPAAIYRLSSIIGHSRTGVVRQFNYTHRLLRLFPSNVLPVVPGVPDAPVDLIATDWASDALFQLFVSRFEAGKVFHICAGPARSMGVEEMIHLARCIFESTPEARKWLPIRVPKLVSLAEYRTFVEEANRGKDRLLKETIRVLDYFLPHLGMRQEFDWANTCALLPHLELPPIREYFAAMVEYCLATDWGRRQR
ncbi:MAG TPA: SDR family oxidoreductase [Bryobacteraceae bacterium]|nr:SDR family oxidoreductase [Bryobacteraceae bacterium]